MRSRLLVTLALAACARTETVTRHVNLHVTGSCPIPSGTFGEYVATGDFEPAFPNHSSLIPTDQPELTIDGVPGDVQSLALVVEQTPSFLGVTLVPPTGDVDMLLLPSASACALNGTGVGFTPGMVFGAVSPNTLIASGATVDKLQPSFRIDLRTGRVARMTHGIGKARTEAAFAALGDGRAMVIGGVSGSSAQQSGEIYDDGTGDFEADTFQLQATRADHGAVALANGDVLVVGGQNLQGLIVPTERITFDGTRWRANQTSTPPLDKARLNPYVLHLADGSVLVGGGFDESGTAVSDVEFFSADGSAKLQPTPLLTTAMHAFVALDGGGALFVDGLAGQHAYFIAPNVAWPIKPDVTATFTDVKLFPRAGGGALLWTGSTWLAFDPWSGFSAIASAPSSGPSTTSPIASGDPGLRAWVGSDPSGPVSVWRDSVRNAFATDAAYLVTDTSLVTPDRLPAPTFADGALALDIGVSAFVADARYLDVAIDVDGDAHVVVRAPAAEVEIGRDCPLVLPASGTEHLRVERHGAIVSFAQGGGPLAPCAAIAADARVAVGVRGGGALSHAKNLVVTRLAAALR